MIVTTSPALLSEDQALSVVEKAVKLSKAEEVFVSLSTGEESLSRFSENQISQNISKTVFSLSITSYFGNKSASAAVTEFDEDAIASAVKRSEELARIAPADPRMDAAAAASNLRFAIARLRRSNRNCIASSAGRIGAASLREILPGGRSWFGHFEH
ncbi:PmbA/TldA family metallopeptidase [Microcoleus vaginatus]|uniref:PmbA/TldA family metallopeptidase n=1 Tax=Microcoleus vaginatus TaxID=119532 RepID=UPI00403F7DEB